MNLQVLEPLKRVPKYHYSQNCENKRKTTIFLNVKEHKTSLTSLNFEIL